MPDLQQFAITPQQNTQNLTGMPRMVVSGRLVDSQTQQPIPGGDFTGANAFDLLAEVKNRTPEQQLIIANELALLLLYMKAGFASGRP